jgi:uncharacterized DUF497 family protein
MYIRGGRIVPGDVVHERNDLRFVWDRGKAQSNFRKHAVSFENACEIFFDPFVHLLRSEMLGGEEREAAIGMTEGWRLLIVVYTFRSEAIRIISARLATPGERNLYEDSTAP